MGVWEWGGGGGFGWNRGLAGMGRWIEIGGWDGWCRGSVTWRGIGDPCKLTLGVGFKLEGGDLEERCIEEGCSYTVVLL